MRFHLFLLFFFSHHQFISTTVAYSINDYRNFLQNNSAIHIDLYQCDTNKTIFNSNITPNDTTGSNNSMISCNISCCETDILNKTTFSNTCQVTVQSTTGICLGRLCYSGKCDRFSSLANMTDDPKIENKTTIINEIHSSSSYIPSFSLINSTQTKWNTWIDKTGLTIRHSILILLLIASTFLTLVTLIVVIKSVRHANIIAGRKSYRYTLL